MEYVALAWKVLCRGSHSSQSGWPYGAPRPRLLASILAGSIGLRAPTSSTPDRFKFPGLYVKFVFDEYEIIEMINRLLPCIIASRMQQIRDSGGQSYRVFAGLACPRPKYPRVCAGEETFSAVNFM